jgi:hypothetical protein
MYFFDRPHGEEFWLLPYLYPPQHHQTFWILSIYTYLGSMFAHHLVVLIINAQIMAFSLIWSPENGVFGIR